MGYIKQFINKKRIINPLGIADAVGLTILYKVFFFVMSYVWVLFFIPKDTIMFVAATVGNYLIITLILRFNSKYDYNDSQLNSIKFSGKIYLVIALFFIGYFLIGNLTIIKMVQRAASSSNNLKEFQDFVDKSNPLLRAVSLCILSPIFEEIFFRGIILEGLLKKYNYKIAIIISAILFSISHGNIPQIINAILFGLLFGYLYYKTHSLRLCIFAHVFNNSFATIILKLIYSIPLLNGPIGFVVGFLILLITFAIGFKWKNKLVIQA